MVWGEMETTGFFIICGAALLAASLMVYFRLGAAGAPVKTVLWLLAELWISLGLAAVTLAVLSRMIGPRAGTGALVEIRDLASRFHELSANAQVLFIVGVAAASALFVRSLVRLSREMREHPL